MRKQGSIRYPTIGSADIRFDGQTLKLLAGADSGPPASTNGIAIPIGGNVTIGTGVPGAKLTVVGGGVDLNTGGVALRVISQSSGPALVAVPTGSSYAADLQGKVKLDGPLEISQAGRGIVFRSPDG